MWERITTTRWRLSKDSQNELASVLIAIRQECEAAMTARGYAAPPGKETVVEGSADNYKQQVQAIDRVLSRINGAFDVQRLNSAMQILSHALSIEPSRMLSTRSIDAGVRKYGVVALDFGGSGEPNAGSSELAGETGEESASTLDTDGGSRPLDTDDEHDRPGG